MSAYGTSSAAYPDTTLMKVGYALAAIFIPPLAVGIKTGDPCETLINFGLWMLGIIPACIHALVVCFLPGQGRLSCFPEYATSVPPGQLLQQEMGGMGKGAVGVGGGGYTGAPAGGAYGGGVGPSSATSAVGAQTAYQTVPTRAY